MSCLTPFSRLYMDCTSVKRVRDGKCLIDERARVPSPLGGRLLECPLRRPRGCPLSPWVRRTPCCLKKTVYVLSRPLFTAVHGLYVREEGTNKTVSNKTYRTMYPSHLGGRTCECLIRRLAGCPLLFWVRRVSRCLQRRKERCLTPFSRLYINCTSVKRVRSRSCLIRRQ